MATIVKLNQLERSSTVGSILSTNGSNILTYVAPPTNSVLWGYDHGETSSVPITIGTNLSYDAGTNTLNASAGAGGYADVLNDGAGFTNSNTNTKLNFIGSALQAADGGAGETDITIATILNTIATDGAVTLSTSVTGLLPFANLADGSALSVLGRSANSSGVMASIAAATDNQVLRRSGTTLGFGSINLASTDAVTGVLDEANGGTGNSTYAIGDILFASTTSVLSRLADVATGNALISGGVGVAPSYGKIGLTTHVSGTLPVANGGTGAATLTGILQGNGTSAVTAIGNSSTVGQVLRVTGASTYAWGALDLADTDAVTGVLSITNGGTGSATQNWVDLTTNQTIAGTKTFSSNITINATPSSNTDAATVGWVLDNVAGLKSGSVRGSTIATLAITARTATTLTVGGTSLILDGVTYANGETILVRHNTTGAGGGAHDQGVYVVSGVGTSIVLTRVAWMNTASEIDGVYVLVQDGTTMNGTLWFTVSEVTTLGTDAISFTQIATSGTIGGTVDTNKVAYGSATNTLTTTTNFHFNGTQLAVGTASPAASTMFTTQGTGVSDTSFGICHNNSSNAQVFRVSDNGKTEIGNTNPLTIDNTSITRSGAITMQVSGIENKLWIRGSSSATSKFDAIELRTENNAGTRIYNAHTNGITTVLTVDTIGKTHTSGEFKLVDLNSTYFPGSGSGTHISLSIANTINQTGGTGITRGIRINPTLTAAADYRALELTTNASHYSIFSTAGKIRFDLGSDATGDTFYRGASGELVRLAAGATSGHVLTSNGPGVAPSWQAAATATTVTRAYLTSSTASVIDLDSGTAVTDIDGNNVTFTTAGLSANQIFVVRNGITLSQSGTVNRDYTLNTGTGVLTLATALSTDEDLMVYKIV